MKSDTPDSEVPLSVRDVAYLATEPAFADRPDPDGVPGVIVHLACANEVEQPMLFSLPDTRRLIRGLLEALHFHDDPTAERCLTVLPPPEDAHDAVLGGASESGMGHKADHRPEAISQVGPLDDPFLLPDRHLNPETGGLKPSSLCIRVQWPCEPKPTPHQVLGAYRLGSTVFLMYRFDLGGGPRPAPADTIMRIVGDHVEAAALTRDEYLPVRDWRRFGRLRVGAGFRIGEAPILGRKMGRREIKALIEGKVFPVQYPRAK